MVRAVVDEESGAWKPGSKILPIAARTLGHLGGEMEKQGPVLLVHPGEGVVNSRE